MLEKLFGKRDTQVRWSGLLLIYFYTRTHIQYMYAKYIYVQKRKWEASRSLCVSRHACGRGGRCGLRECVHIPVVLERCLRYKYKSVELGLINRSLPLAIRTYKSVSFFVARRRRRRRTSEQQQAAFNIPLRCRVGLLPIPFSQSFAICFPRTAPLVPFLSLRFPCRARYK